LFLQDGGAAEEVEQESSLREDEHAHQKGDDERVHLVRLSLHAQPVKFFCFLVVSLVERHFLLKLEIVVSLFVVQLLELGETNRAINWRKIALPRQA